MSWTNKKLKKRISFEEVVATWLKGEWYYSFYDKHRKSVSGKIINNPDLFSVKENQVRLELLKANRGDIVNRLPDKIKWYLVDFRKEDINRTFLIPMANGWVSRVTKGSCKLVDSLNKDNWLPESRDHHEHIEKIESLCTKKIINDKLVFITSDVSSSFTCIEGNHRLIAKTIKALESEEMDTIINNVYLGVSSSMQDCDLYAEKYFSTKSSEQLL